MVFVRPDGRKPDELRPIKITAGFTEYAEGSILYEMGSTRVLCNATVQIGVPPHKKGSGEGWVTAEYSMLPRSTLERTNRETTGLKGRTHEIQRLIGRSLRAVVDLSALGERSIVLDCDVLQADGGTRTAAINGAYHALSLAVEKLLRQGVISKNPIREPIGAVSVGIVQGNPVLDLNYAEDFTADTDMNFVMTGSGRFVELQGSAEKDPFTMEQLNKLMSLAQGGINQILKMPRQAAS